MSVGFIETSVASILAEGHGVLCKVCVHASGYFLLFIFVNIVDVLARNITNITTITIIFVHITGDIVYHAYLSVGLINALYL